MTSTTSSPFVSGLSARDHIRILRHVASELEHSIGHKMMSHMREDIASVVKDKLKLACTAEDIEVIIMRAEKFTSKTSKREEQDEKLSAQMKEVEDLIAQARTTKAKAEVESKHARIVADYRKMVDRRNQKVSDLHKEQWKVGEAVRAFTEKHKKWLQYNKEEEKKRKAEEKQEEREAKKRKAEEEKKAAEREKKMKKEAADKKKAEDDEKRAEKSKRKMHQVLDERTQKRREEQKKENEAKEERNLLIDCLLGAMVNQDPLAKQLFERKKKEKREKAEEEKMREEKEEEEGDKENIDPSTVEDEDE